MFEGMAELVEAAAVLVSPIAWQLHSAWVAGRVEIITVALSAVPVSISIFSAACRQRCALCGLLTGLMERQTVERVCGRREDPLALTRL